LPSHAWADLAAEVRSRTATYLLTEVKDQVRALRDRLTPDDQAILVLRVDRDLPWRDIARIMADEGESLTEPELVRRAAALRKRFERIKDELRALAQAAGLGSGSALG
jgi:RNA polymerase sigma-70 factor (ECF subfamily)